MKSLRLAGIAWILAAIVAGLLGAFILGLGERPEGRTQGLLLCASAVLAGGTGLLGLRWPSTTLARWSVLLTVGWLIASIVGIPWYQNGQDLVVLVLLPAVLPVVAGLSSLWSLRRGPQ